MTKRDRYILMGVAVLALVGAYWFLALAPKRDRLAKVDTDLSSAKQTLAQSEQEKVEFAKAQTQFPTLYASLGRLGKAVPDDEDVPSLLVQLNDAASRAGVDFNSIELKLDLAEQLGSAATATAASSASGPSTGATGATGPAGATGGTATASTSTAAPATAATGTSGGAATGTLQPLPFEYKFKGSFYNLEGLIHNVSRLVQKRNRSLAISGRLVVIEGFAMERKEVTIVAATYLLPADQGLFAGATPAGPAGATAATPQPASASASAAATPPSAAVTAP